MLFPVTDYGATDTLSWPIPSSARRTVSIIDPSRLNEVQVISSHYNKIGDGETAGGTRPACGQFRFGLGRLPENLVEKLSANLEQDLAENLVEELAGNLIENLIEELAEKIQALPWGKTRLTTAMWLATIARFPLKMLVLAVSETRSDPIGSSPRMPISDPSVTVDSGLVF
jgi:hypothetical protein